MFLKFSLEFIRVILPVLCIQKCTKEFADIVENSSSMVSLILQKTKTIRDIKLRKQFSCDRNIPVQVLWVDCPPTIGRHDAMKSVDSAHMLA